MTFVTLYFPRIIHLSSIMFYFMHFALILMYSYFLMCCHSVHIRHNVAPANVRASQTCAFNQQQGHHIQDNRRWRHVWCHKMEVSNDAWASAKEYEAKIWNKWWAIKLPYIVRNDIFWFICFFLVLRDRHQWMLSATSMPRILSSLCHVERCVLILSSIVYPFSDFTYKQRPHTKHNQWEEMTASRAHRSNYDCHHCDHNLNFLISLSLCVYRRQCVRVFASLVHTKRNKIR